MLNKSDKNSLYLIFYLQVITVVHFKKKKKKIAVLEICSENKTKESVIGTLYIYTYMYINLYKTLIYVQ